MGVSEQLYVKCKNGRKHDKSFWRKITNEVACDVLKQIISTKQLALTAGVYTYVPEKLRSATLKTKFTFPPKHTPSGHHIGILVLS